MDSKALNQLKDNFEEALSEIAQKRDFSPRDLEHATKLLCAIEKIKTLEEDTGYSGRRSYEGGGGSYRSYEGGNSNRSYDDRSYDDRSYNSYDGYSGHSPQEKMLKKLKSMMGEAENEQERRIMKEWIDRLER